MICLLVQNGPTIVDTYRHYIIIVVQRQYDVTRVPLRPPRTHLPLNITSASVVCITHLIIWFLSFLRQTNSNVEYS